MGDFRGVWITAASLWCGICVAGCSTLSWETFSDSPDSNPIDSLEVRAQPILAIAFSPDGKSIATQHGHAFPSEVRASPLHPLCSVHLWDAQSRYELASLAFETSSMRINFTDDGTRLVILDLTKETTSEWNIAENRLEKFPGIVVHEVSPDGTLATRERDDGRTEVFQFPDGTPTLVGLKADHQFAQSFSGDNRMLLIEVDAEENSRRQLVVWDLEKQMERSRVTLPSGCYLWQFSGDGCQIVTADAGDAGFALSVWNAANGSPERTIQVAGAEVRAIAISHNGRFVAACGEGEQGWIRAWNTTTGRQVAEYADLDSWGVTAIAFSPKRQLVTGNAAGQLKFWNVPGLDEDKLSQNSKLDVADETASVAVAN